MNRIDDMLQFAVSEQDIAVPALSADEIERITQLAINKLGKRGIGKKRLVFILVAAFFMLSAATAFASVYLSNIGRVFEPVFEEQNEAGEIVPLNEKLPLVELAGVMVEQTVVRGNLSVAVRGVVGDNESVSLLLEVSDINGDPIGTGDLSGPGQIEFGRVYLHIDDGQEGAYEATGQYCQIKRIDNKSEPSRMTFLIQEHIDNPEISNIAGNRATLELSGFGELTIEDSRRISFDYDDLLTLSKHFPEPAEEDFHYFVFTEEMLDKRRKFEEENPGYSAFKHIKKDSAGNYISDPYLPDSGTRLSLSPDYPHTYIAAMGFWQDEFHLALVCEDESEFNGILNNGLMPVNKKTGEFHSQYGMQGGFYDTRTETDLARNDLDPDYKQSRLGSGYIYLIAPGINDLTDLLFQTGGMSYHKLLSEETWRFEFDLDYVNTSLVYEVEQSLNWNDSSFMVDRISISPFSIKIVCSNWLGSAASPEMPVRLRMKDGSSMDLPYLNVSSDKNGVICQTLFTIVIDAEQVECVYIGDNEVLL